MTVGLVEVDETDLPCRSRNDPLSGSGGRSHQGKILIAGAVEVQEKGPGRIRLSVIKDFSADSLHGFLRAAVAATAKTDGWSAIPARKASPTTHTS
jgi:hypothetical protein